MLEKLHGPIYNNYSPSPVNNLIFRMSSASRRSSSETALSLCWRTVQFLLPFGRRERDNYHERGSFKAKLCQHVYASTMAEQIEGNLLATLKSSFYYTKLLAEIWKQV